MSMFADLTDTVRKAKDKYRLTEGDAIELLIDIMGGLEWDLDGVDYDADSWQEQEKEAAKKILFPAPLIENKEIPKVRHDNPY